MVDGEITVKYPRRFALVGVLIGAAVLWMALDMRFFHTVEGWSGSARESWVVFGIAALIGTAFFFPSLRALVRPPVVLRADRQGVTVYAVLRAEEWDAAQGRFVQVLNPGDPRQIPWALVESVAESKPVRRGRAAGGTGSGGVRLLMDRSVNLDGCTREGVLHARTGSEPWDITSEDREYFSDAELEERVKSEIVVPARVIGGRTRAFAEALEGLKKVAL